MSGSWLGWRVDGETYCFAHGDAAKDAAVDDGWLVPLLDSDGYAEEDRRCRSCDLLLS